MSPRLVTFFVFILLPLCASAATIRVPADQPTIQAGIDAAVDGDTVLPADGTCRGEGNRGVLFHGKAVTLRSENGPATCIVDAEFAKEWFEDKVLSFSENERRNTVVDELTITGGYTWGISVSDAALQPTPIIRNCIITGNNTASVSVGASPSSATAPSSTTAPKPEAACSKSRSGFITSDHI